MALKVFGVFEDCEVFEYWYPVSSEALLIFSALGIFIAVS